MLATFNISILWLVSVAKHVNFTLSRTQIINFLVILFICTVLLQKQAVEYLRMIALAEAKQAKHLCNAAQYNIGRAYYQGYGVKRQSDKEAEK